MSPCLPAGCTVPLPIERPRAKLPRVHVANVTNTHPGESDGSQTAAVSGTSDPEPPAKVEPTGSDKTPVVHVPARSDTPTPGHARTPIVAASSVTKLSGSFPTIKGDTDGDVQIKVCIDEQGQVSSAKVLTSTVELPDDLPHALESWRYKPYLNKDNKPSPACFVWSSRVVVKRAD